MPALSLCPDSRLALWTVYRYTRIIDSRIDIVVVVPSSIQMLTPDRPLIAYAVIFK